MRRPDFFEDKYSYYDREGQILEDHSCSFICIQNFRTIACGAAGIMTFTANYGRASTSNLFESRTLANTSLNLNVNPYVVSSYGGAFVHKAVRKVVVAP